ncbi:MAG: ABC transporter permease [Lactobacillus sp.]|nr:ABC transporter permease [Lactobacillus sp.]
MNPLDFRKKSMGIRAIKIVANNELRAFLRNKGLLLSMFMEPLITYGLLVLALSSVYPSVHYMGLTLSYRQYALTGVLTFFVTTQMSQAMYRATIDKTYGLLAIKFLNGIQPWHYIIGMSFFPILGLLFESLILIILGSFTAGIYNLGYLLLSLIPLVIGLQFWTSLGIILSTRITSYEKRDIVMTLIFSPVAYAAPTLYVFSNNLPWIIKGLSIINPLTYQLEAIRTVAFGEFDFVKILVDFLITVVMVAITQFVLKKLPLSLAER